MSNFQQLEVVVRDSKTPPQVVENLNKLTYQDKGQHFLSSIRIKGKGPSQVLYPLNQITTE